MIADMNIGDVVEGFYLLRAATSKITTNGKPFLSGTLEDASGILDMKVWDYSGPISNADAGKVIKIRGEISEFRGSLQLTVARIRMADEKDNYDIQRLVPVAPIDIDARVREVSNLIATIEDDDYRRMAETMFERHKESFIHIPAAKTVHHSFLSGLLMHTSNMLVLADFLANIYYNIIDRSLLLTGTLLHDFAKAQEFSFSELGIVTDYSVKGQLLGHLVMGAQEVADVAKELGMPENKSILLQHLVLSHHGEPEFGAAVRPVCAEAELLSYIDLIDSRMEIYEETFTDVPVGEFSKRLFALDKCIYHHE